jgi:hypothetical protein
MADEAIFLGGTRQAVRWAYAMEAHSPHEPTAHAKLIQEDDGYLAPPAPVGIELGAMKSTERFGQAAQLRMQIEEALEGNDDLLYTIWSRYSDMERGKKVEGMRGLGRLLCSGKNFRRSKELIADCVYHIVCTDKQREAHTMHAISRKHGISMGTVHNTVVALAEVLRENEDEAMGVLRKWFKSTGIVP